MKLSQSHRWALSLLCVPFIFSPAFAQVEPAELLQYPQWISPQKALSAISTYQRTSKACTQESYAKKLSDRFLMSFTVDQKPCRIYDLNYPSFWKEQKNLPILEVQSPPSIKKLADDFGGGQHLKDLAQLNPTLKLNSQDSALIKNALLKSAPQLTQQQILNGLTLKQLLSKHDHQIKKFNESLASTINQVGLSKKIVMDEGQIKFDYKSPIKDLEFLNQPEALLNEVVIHEDPTGRIQVQMSPQLAHFGATSLVDFNQPQKIFIETLIQQVTSFAATRVVQLLPQPVIANILSTAINDLFQLIQLNHFEQLYHLEAVLLQNLRGQRQNGFEIKDLQSSLDLLYAHQNRALLESALSGIKNGFSNENWFRGGHIARENAEQYRSSNRNNAINKLKHQSLCTFRQINELFGICEQNGKPHSLYSLTSQESFAYIKFGPKILYSYVRPWQVTTLKGFAWGVSSSVRVLNPFQKINFFGLFRLSGFIAQVFSNYAQEGLREQALWWQHLNYAKESHLSDPAMDEIQTHWYKAQSLNPVNLFRTQY